MDSPYWKGPLPGVDVQRRYLWKTFRGKPNSIPGSARKCSASARNPVRLQPGILFGFTPECCSASARNPVRLAPEYAYYQWDARILSNFCCVRKMSAPTRQVAIAGSAVPRKAVAWRTAFLGTADPA